MINPIYEHQLLELFAQKLKEYEEVDQQVDNFYSNIVNTMLEEPETTIDQIKERLRAMPFTAGKTLLFRKLLLIESDRAEADNNNCKSQCKNQ